jgi:hypothetical protein
MPDQTVAGGPQIALKLQISVSRRLKKINTYQIDGNPINTVQEHNHFDLIFDSKFNFNQHCDMIVNKERKKFRFFKSLCKYVDGITFLKLYKTYVLPILESILICWERNKIQFNRIEKVQKIITKVESTLNHCAWARTLDLVVRWQILDFSYFRFRRKKIFPHFFNITSMGEKLISKNHLTFI